MTNMTRFLLVTVLFLGCGGGVEHTRVAPGQFSVVCDGRGMQCHARAGELCPRGFSVLDGNTATATHDHGWGPITRTGTTILVECK